jgi:hypothetical protein
LWLRNISQASHQKQYWFLALVVVAAVRLGSCLSFGEIMNNYRDEKLGELWRNDPADDGRIFGDEPGKQVRKVVTPDGVVGLIAVGIPEHVLEALRDKLHKRIAARRRGEQVNTENEDLGDPV